jgi:hypothetical protein
MPGLMNRDEWRQNQEAAINAEIARQVGEAHRRAQEAGNAAVANAGGRERAEVLERQLNASEGLKQGHFERLETATAQVQDQIALSERLAVQLAQGGGGDGRSDNQVRPPGARKSPPGACRHP